MAKRTVGRVKIDKNPKMLLLLAQAIFDKHRADGAQSLLANLQDVDLNDLGPKIATVLATHLTAEEYKRKAEEAYRERDKEMGNIEKLVRSSASLLKGVYKKNPKKLGEWGFEVDDSAPVKKETAPAKKDANKTA